MIHGRTHEYLPKPQEKDEINDSHICRALRALWGAGAGKSRLAQMSEEKQRKRRAMLEQKRARQAEKEAHAAAKREKRLASSR